MPLLDKVQSQGSPPGGAPADPPPAPAAGTPPGGGAPPEAMSAPGGAQQDGLTEQEQDAQLDDFINNAYQIIYGGQSADGEINPQIAELLQSGAAEGGQQARQAGVDIPVQALAQTASTIGARLATGAAENGRSLDGPGVVLPGTIHLVETLADVAAKEEIYDYSEQEMAAAATQASEMLFQQTQDLGLWSQEEMDRGVQEMMVADKAGVLDQMQQEGGQQEGQPGAGGAAPPPEQPPQGGMA